MTTTEEPGAKNLIHCSFCRKNQKQVPKLVAGPGVYICNECIDLCNNIIAEELLPQFATPTDDLSDDQLIAYMTVLHQSYRDVDARVAAVVRDLRARGVTWARIGEALGITRQSAWERYSGEE